MNDENTGIAVLSGPCDVIIAEKCSWEPPWHSNSESGCPKSIWIPLRTQFYCTSGEHRFLFQFQSGLHFWSTCQTYSPGWVLESFQILRNNFWTFKVRSSLFLELDIDTGESQATKVFFLNPLFLWFESFVRKYHSILLVFYMKSLP